MIRLIGTRWKYSNVWSRGVLIGRNSCKEQCVRTVSTESVLFIAVHFVMCEIVRKSFAFPNAYKIEYATQVAREMVSGPL